MMTYLEFTSSVVKSIAWPVVTLAGVLVFRRPIAELIPSIKEISATSLKFDQGLRKIEPAVRASKIAAGIEPSIKELTADTGGNTNKIVVAWNELEQAVRQRLTSIGIDASSLSALPLIQQASERQLINEEQRRSLSGLNALRNLAVHGGDKDLDERRTNDFLNMADAMKTVLDITRS